MKYRKKPVIIDAVRWEGQPVQKIRRELSVDGPVPILRNLVTPTELIIKTLEGDMTASWGDYIIKGVDGEVYPCKPEIFEKTYDHA